MRGRGWKQTKRGNQHGHHDGTESEDGAFYRGVLNRVTLYAKLIDVFEHDDSCLHGDTEERKEADTRGDAKVCVRKEHCEQAADRRHGNVNENEAGPFARTEHRVEDYEDDDERDGKNDQ